MGRGYTKVYNSIITDNTISAGAFRVYCYIASRPPGWVFNCTIMSKALNMGRNALYDYLRVLEAADYITREQQRGENGEYRGTTITVSQKSGYRKPVSRPSVSRKPAPLNKTDINKTDINKTECEPPAASGGTHTSLDLFRMNLTKAAEGKRVPAAILRKFEAYWTQEAKDGRQLWQVTRPFDFAKRLNKWLEDERAI